MTLASTAFRYTWLPWSSAFLLPWMLLFVARPALRPPMAWASLLTAPFLLGLKWLWPGYVKVVWNLDALISWRQRDVATVQLTAGRGKPHGLQAWR